MGFIYGGVATAHYLQCIQHDAGDTDIGDAQVAGHFSLLPVVTAQLTIAESMMCEGCVPLISAPCLYGATSDGCISHVLTALSIQGCAVAHSFISSVV